MVAGYVTDVTLTERLAAIEAELDAISLDSYPRQSLAEARSTAASLRKIQSRVATHAGAAMRAVEWVNPNRTTSQDIARDFGRDQHTARRELKDADTLSTASLTEQAAADGSISHKHATVIGRALNDLPADVTAEQRAFAEKALIRDASHLSPTDLAVRGRRITDQYKTSEDEVDADEDALLWRREALARAKTSVQVWDNHDGTYGIRGIVPELHGRIIKTVLDAYTAPRRDHLNPAADPFETHDHKQGVAFCHLIEHLPVDGLPTTGGTPIRIIITLDETKLRSQVAAATLATGERISAGELRRLAANHDIIPMVLGGDSVPIDLGRAARIFSKEQRETLAVLDGGCTAPGCDRPPAWCEVQHTNRWAKLGQTNLADGTLHCNACHHRADAENWQYKRIQGRIHINRGTGKGWETNHRYRP